MQLYLIRHGQSYVNLKEWDQGNADEPLTDLGVQQARALAAWLPGHLPQIDALYASTMQRAKQTAEIVAAPYGLTPIMDDRLRELGNNRLDHSAYSIEDLPREWAEYWGARPFAPTMVGSEDVETVMHARTRVGLFVEEVVEQHPDEVVVVVCHGGVVECVFGHIFNVGPWGRCEVWDFNTGLSHFEYVEAPGKRSAWRLHFHNRVEHLSNLEQ